MLDPCRVRFLKLFSQSETALFNPCFFFFSSFLLLPRCIMYYISYIIRDRQYFHIYQKRMKNLYISENIHRDKHLFKLVKVLFFLQFLYVLSLCALCVIWQYNRPADPISVLPGPLNYVHKGGEIKTYKDFSSTDSASILPILHLTPQRNKLIEVNHLQKQ